MMRKIWLPLPNEAYHTDGPELIVVKDARLTIYSDNVPPYVDLQQGYALCRLVEVADAHTPPVPTPEIFQTLWEMLMANREAAEMALDEPHYRESARATIVHIDEALAWLQQLAPTDKENQ